MFFFYKFASLDIKNTLIYYAPVKRFYWDNVLCRNLAIFLNPNDMVCIVLLKVNLYDVENTKVFSRARTPDLLNPRRTLDHITLRVKSIARLLEVTTTLLPSLLFRARQLSRWHSPGLLYVSVKNFWHH